MFPDDIYSVSYFLISEVSSNFWDKLILFLVNLIIVLHFSGMCFLLKACYNVTIAGIMFEYIFVIWNL